MIFPATNDFVISDEAGQSLKILDEAGELNEAIKHHDEVDQLEEAMDLLQALANLCRIKGWSHSQLLAAYQSVERKNRQRGRYSDG